MNTSHVVHRSDHPNQGSLAAVARLAAAVVLGLLVGCGPPQVRTPETSTEPAEVSPLGPSYKLIPLPSADDSLLGRILHEPPLPGQALEEVSAPNPCAAELGPPKPTPLSNTFEDAQELAFSTSARAKLGAFGFSADANRATHFVYRLTTQQRVSRVDTTGYVECCKENDCGYGYVSTLVFGEGEYATGEETSGGGSVDIAFAGAEGHVALRVLHRRKVKGYVAAVVKVTDQTKAPAAEPEPGATIPESVRKVYEANQISTQAAEGTYQFVDGRGNVITENEFVRRYRDVTGSDELDDFERHRNVGWATFYTIGGVVLIGAAAGTIGGIVSATSEDESDTGDDKLLGSVFAGALLGGPGVALLAFGILEWVGESEGEPTEHYLTDPQASLYAERYNRKLLRKTVREMRKVHKETSSAAPAVRVAPYVGPTGAGVVGRF